MLYRRVWTMAVFDGQLFAGTLPSGHVWRMRAGQVATLDRELPSGWHHLAAVRQGGLVRLYLDGKPVASVGEVGGPALDLSNELPLSIGSGPHDYFLGAMSDLRLYGRALTEAQVAALAGGEHE